MQPMRVQSLYIKYRWEKIHTKSASKLSKLSNIKIKGLEVFEVYKLGKQ